MKQWLIKNRKGAAAVEFAIVLPLLLLVLFGIIEFSVIMYDQAMITNASREGARAGIVFRSDNTRYSETQIQGVVSSYLQNNLINFSSEPENLVVTAPNAQCPSGEHVTVNVSYDYDFLVLPNFANSLGGPITLSARTTMRME